MAEPSQEARRLGESIHRLISSEAKSVIQEGRATLILDSVADELAVRLAPRSSHAASLDAFVESEYQVTCVLGSDNGLPYEIFSRNSEEILDEIQGLVRAVIEGQYSEQRNDSGKRSKIIGDWISPNGRRRPRYNVVRIPSPGDSDWRTVTYKPY